MIYWNKWKTAIIEKKKIVFVFLGIGIIFLFAAFLMYKQQVANAMSQPRFEMSIENQAWQKKPEKIPLSDTNVVKQQISMVSEGITGIALYLEEGDDESSDIIIRLKEQNGELIQEWKKPAEEILGQGFQYFYLPELMQTTQEEVYTVEVTTQGSQGIPAYLRVVDLSNYKGNNPLLHEIEADELPDSEAKYTASYGILNGDCGSVKYFFVLFVMLGLAILAATGLILISGQKKEWIFVEIALLIGVIFLLIIPPYVVPDEGTHFVTAYAKSSRLLGEEVADEDGMVILSPEAASYLSRDESPDKSSYANYIRGLLGKKESIVIEEVNSRKELSVIGLGYAPQILGISLARILGSNAEWLFVSGRLVALLWYCFVMFWAIRLIPKFAKNILFIVGLTPMTIQMIVSYNYDSILIGTTFFLTAYLLYLAYDPNKEKINIRDYGLLILALIVIVPLKVVYIPILGLGLLIPKEKFGGMKQKVGAASMLLAVSAVSLLVMRLGALVKMTGADGAGGGTEMTYSLFYCIAHPIQTVVVFWNTLLQYSSNYVETMVGNGLGWLEIGLPSILTYGFVFLLILSTIQRQGELKIWKTGNKIWMLFLTAVGCFLVCFALMLDWTSVNSTVISGVQGRYFIPLLPMTLLIFQNQTIVLKKNIDYLLIGSTCVMHLMVAMSVISFVIAR